MRSPRIVAAIVGAFLLHAGSAPAQTIVSFSGFDWVVKDSDGVFVGPGPNVFSDDVRSVRVDRRGRLHLRVKPIAGVWTCAEVVSVPSFGYGTYRFYLSRRVDALDPNVVLGLFTWSDSPAENHREIDIEFSRWGNGLEPTNAQYVVQPYDVPGNLVRWTQPRRPRKSTHRFTWQPGSVAFQSLAGHNAAPPDGGHVVAEHTMTAGIPTAGGENARINLWLFGGQPPLNGRAAYVIIERFEFEPLR
jgi:hypothetical protein